MNASQTSSQGQDYDLIKPKLPSRVMVREGESLSRTQKADQTGEEWVGSAQKEFRKLQPLNPGSSARSEHTFLLDARQESTIECNSPGFAWEKKEDGHSCAPATHSIKPLKHKQPQPSKKLLLRKANTLATATSKMPIFVKRSFHKGASNSSKLLPGREPGRNPLSHLPLSVRASHIFDRSIPPPDFNVTQLWEEVREKINLTDQVSSEASEVMNRTLDTLAHSPVVHQTQPKDLVRYLEDSSRIPIILQVGNVTGRPQFAADVGLTVKQAQSATRSSAVDHEYITELINRIVPELDEAANGVLEIEQEPWVEELDSKLPLDHICPKLRHLRFQDSHMEIINSTHKRLFSLDVVKTFATLSYPDSIEPSVILGSDNIGATFLSQLESVFDDDDTRPRADWRQDARKMFMMQLRMHRPDLNLSLKREFVESLHSFCYEEREAGYLDVFMMSVETVPDPGDSVVPKGAIRASSPAALEDTRGSKKQPSPPRKAVQAVARLGQSLLQRPARRLGRGGGSGSSKNQRVRTTGVLANHGSHGLTEKTPAALSSSKKATHGSLQDALPCSYCLVARFDLNKEEDRTSFHDLNVVIMRWGQARFGWNLAKKLHQLRAWKSDPKAWIMSDAELQNYWGDVIGFKVEKEGGAGAQ